MNIKRTMLLIPMMIASLSFNANANTDTLKTCDDISSIGSMVMQLRQYKPEVSKDYLQSKLSHTDNDKSSYIVNEVIEQAFEVEIAEGKENKRNAIIAFQVKVIDFCLSEM